MKSALFIGRFQPFHNGHLEVVKKILKDYERVIIVIGSAEKNFLPTNPLTAGERIELIEAGMKEAKISHDKYITIPVRNVNNYGLWVNHTNIYVPQYEAIFTGSAIVRACYEGKYNKTHRKNKVGPKIHDINERFYNISATEIRDAMIVGQKWEQMVPKAVAKLLKEWNIAKRLDDVKGLPDLSDQNNKY